MTDVECKDYMPLTLPPLLASLVRRNFRRYHIPTIYLPQYSHHTYLLWHFHSHSGIYCHATFHRSVHMTRIMSHPDFHGTTLKMINHDKMWFDKNF